MLTPRTRKFRSGVIVLLFGLAVTGYSIFNLSMGSSSTNWPTTEGQILESEFKTKGDSTSYPGVKYQYDVNGKTYDGERIVFGSAADLPRGTLDRYPVGGTVTVFYDPNDPESAVLQTASTSSMYIGIVLGPILVIVAIIMLTLAARRFSVGSR